MEGARFHSAPLRPCAARAASTLWPSRMTALNARNASADFDTPHTLRPIVAPWQPARTALDPARTASDIAVRAARRFFALGPPAATTGAGELATTCRNESTSP